MNRLSRTKNFDCETTFYHGHLDDPKPLQKRGKVVMNLLDPPFKEWPIGIPTSHVFINHWIKGKKND